VSPSKAAKRTPDYRLRTIRTLPKLQLLDDFNVRQSERRQVRTKPTTPREAGMALRGCSRFDRSAAAGAGAGRQRGG
jgi:hypothetical protein